VGVVVVVGVELLLLGVEVGVGFLLLPRLHL